MPRKAAPIRAPTGCSGMNRRTFLATGFAALASRGFAKGARPLAEAFDREVGAFMKARGIPGGYASSSSCGLRMN